MTKIVESTEDSLQTRPPWWKRFIIWCSKKWFYIALILLAFAGIICAFCIPQNIPGLEHQGNSVTSVRQAILAVFAGALTMLTLWETHRKNTHEKDKNDRDHIRQVHAERRNRYTKAVEQIANEKAAVRLGGIYTLVGLVDEWIADDSLEPDKQQEEGQIIINNLCSYIRTPFLVAEKLDAYEARKDLNVLAGYEAVFSPEEGSPQLQALHKRVIDSSKYKEPEDIAAAYAEHREEQDVRRAIFAEMSKRIKVSQDEVSVISSVWSDFDFDFSRALIFYPLNNLTIGKAIFSSARFYGEADFRDTEFTKDANFRDAKFTENAHFKNAKFTGYTDFTDAEFTVNADFEGAEFTVNADFTGTANFRDTKLTGYVDFTDAKFTVNANFTDAKFTGYTVFEGAEFTGNANFTDAKFTRGTEFTGDANFKNAKFTEDANFKNAKFTGNAYFRKAEFTGNAYFRKAEFTGNIDFTNALFRNSIYYDWASILSSSPRLEPLGIIFHTVKDKVHKKIESHIRYLPLGSRIFDPTSWDETQKKYEDVSEPASTYNDSFETLKRK